ncbi:MAG: SGNH/GDSL hydrolase family protein [Clostridia bacterium]|nr:SGNH/GDSL hydrolase family protein [Clostridia bacterium]
MKAKKWRAVGAVALFLCLCGLLLGMAQALLVPHDRAANPEAFLMHEYMEADVSRDEVVFLGDCEVYESFSPVTLWQEYGIESRVVGTPGQQMWHSYAALCEVLERSYPRVVVLGVYGLVYNEPTLEVYNRMALDALPMSAVRWDAVRTGLTEDETALSYLFPLLRYHDRWSSLTWRDVTALTEPQAPVSSRGYLVKTGVVSADASHPDHEGALPPLTDAFGETALDYFDRIVTLCRESGAQLVLVKAPTDSWRYPWHDEYEMQAIALAERYGLPYYNLLNDFESIDLDLMTDSYDGGLHLNVSGAEKLSVWFGHILTEQYDLSDGRTNETVAGVWQGEIKQYEKMKQEGSAP